MPFMSSSGEGSYMNMTQGLAFILTHLEDLWSKMISTYRTYNAQVPVGCPEQAIRYFAWAKLLDCKISAYPNYTDDFRKGAHDCMITGGVALPQVFSL
jgi:hypothetical protein